MSDQKIYRAIGLMSGTSLDGVDVALLETDGRSHVKPLGFYAQAYDEATRQAVRACFGKRAADEEARKADTLVTAAHIDAVRASGFQGDVIGFHGQTITHDPAIGFTWQLGDGAVLAQETGMDVVYDFRKGDMEAGGQGAPFLPLYHRARVQADQVNGPVAVLNIGGVANVTYINDDDILAFDTGPGNALMDDVVKERIGASFDEGGALARAGHVREDIVQEALDAAGAFFDQCPPKSLDREDWGSVKNAASALSTEDVLATLAAFTVRSIALAAMHFPQAPKLWLVTGGGRKNEFLMVGLSAALNATVEPVEALGWNGDALEAEGFAYLAVRSLLGLPLSVPETTGAREAVTGGFLCKV